MRLLHILAASAFLLMPKLASANHIPEYEQQIFIETWANIAVDHMRQYGIPASITLAQAIVESGWGKGIVALKGNNFFCIKGNNGWTGPIVKAKDDEIDSSSFRKYTNIEESFEDHARFLRQNARYQPLFSLSPKDYKAWSYGLKNCGYATKDDYAEQLISTIERYGLYLYDRAVPDSAIRVLDLPFRDQEEAPTTPVPSPAFELSALLQPLAEDRPSQPTTMQAPRYNLGNEHGVMPSQNGAGVEMPSSNANYKISVILPNASPKFTRR